MSRAPATINATNNGLGCRELGLEARMLDSEPYYVHFFSISFPSHSSCTNAYFDSTYGHYHHQQTLDDTWTTTTASLTKCGYHLNVSKHVHHRH